MIAEVDITGVRLETERLILRPWEPGDLQDFYEYARVDGVGQMAGWLPHESVETSRMILDSFIKHKKCFALELKENGKVIGSLGIEDRDDALPEDMKDLRGRELGYVLSKDYWGRGLMPEAVNAVMAYCFDELHFDFLSCGHFEWNKQSRRVIEKCGFHYFMDIEHETRYGTKEKTLLYLAFPPRNDGLNWIEEVMQGVSLETERLILRPFRFEDSDDCFAFLSDRDGCYMDMGSEPFATKNWEYLWLMERYHSQKSRLMIELKDEEKVVGTVSIWPDSDRAVNAAEIGFCIAPAYQRMGFAEETVRAVTEYLFSSAGVELITASAVPHNKASIGLLTKLGFVFEGITHKGFFCPDRGVVDLNCYYLEK